MRHTDPLRPRAALRCRATSPIHCTSAFLLAGMALFVTSCGGPEPASAPEKIRVLLDTDANNELDDQHAIAYMLMNGDVFDVEGITVNSTFGGGDVNEQAAEAERVVRLLGLHPDVRVYKGANGSFEEIREHVGEDDFDGAEAVRFIIEAAKADDPRPLVLLPVGKLTNIALALEKDRSIASRVRVVWLGSNYPAPGEYNQDNDEGALDYLLDADVPFEIALVRYGEPSGTDAVRVTPERIREAMADKGPRVDDPVEGRHGGTFATFGDYSIDLFEHIDLHGDPPSRALYDLAAVAIVKNPAWAQSSVIPAPQLVDGEWQERPDNARRITLWDNFDRDAILRDLFERMENYVLASGRSNGLTAANAARPRIALIMKSLANEFFATMADGAQAHHATHDDEYELIVNGIKDESDLSQQVALVEQMMATGVDAVVIAPADSRALVPVVKRALAQGIVVVNIDNKLDDETMEQAGIDIPFVGPDNRDGARRVGEVLASRLQPGDKVAILEGIPTAFNAQQRRLGFEEAMQAAGMEIVDVQSGSWEQAKANTVAAAMIAAHPDLGAILASNDNMALGAAAAVRQAGKEGQIAIVGFDNIAAIRQMVADGRVLATADQHADQLAVYGIEYALQILRGEATPEDRQTDVDIITAESL